MPAHPPSPVLPDLLPHGLDVVFCGTAPGHVSAARQAYYAHPQNKFWRILFETGLTPRLLAPSDYPLLTAFGIGLTDIAKFSHGMDKDLHGDALGRTAIAALAARVTACAPRILAFTSKTGGQRFFASPRACGPQPEMLGRTRIWILPSTSPAAQNSWNTAIWHALAAEIRDPARND